MKILPLFLLLLSSSIMAQTWPKAFNNSRWKFSYACEAESQDVLFRAEEEYQHFVWFKYDETVQTYLNGALTKDRWRLAAPFDKLYYNFAQVEHWKVANYNAQHLVLEFELNGGEGRYQYHFIRMSEAETPFFRYDLGQYPEAVVERTIMGSDPHPYRYLKDEPGKRRIPKAGKKDQIRPSSPLDTTPKFEIELVGGGFYGPPDFVRKNQLTINSEGLVKRKLQNEQQGLRVWESQISPAELEQLVAYIEKKGFFEWEQIYPCQTASCMDRLKETPRPVTLSLAISRGHKGRKIVLLPIYAGPDAKQQYLSYPKALDDIVRLLEKVAVEE